MKKQYYIKKDICVATSFPTDLGGSVIKWKDPRDPNFISNSTIYYLCSFRKLFIQCFLLVLEIPIFLVSPIMQQKWVLVEVYARSSCEGALENIIPDEFR